MTGTVFTPSVLLLLSLWCLASVFGIFVGESLGDTLYIHEILRYLFRIGNKMYITQRVGLEVMRGDRQLAVL